MFIIIAIAVASFKYLFSDNYKAIYNDMVVGKGGDTVAIATKPLADVPLEISEKLKQEKLVQFYKKDVMIMSILKQWQCA